MNVYLGIEMGILNEAFMQEMRMQLPEGEFIRQFLCKNVSAQNHIWEKFIRKFEGVFMHDDGRPMTLMEAKSNLLDELSKGHKVIPCGGCDNFDYSRKGCLGHEG